MKSKHSFEPFYNQLSEELALSTGYFVPNHGPINWKQHATIPCTPINFLQTTTSEDKPAIIISTGALCPMHDGHKQMMDIAKMEVESRGYKVIGGYLSPGHDQYIKEKTGDNWMPIHDRIRWANNLIKDSDWLAIDPWEGVFAPGAVNFTSVVYRLQQYIKKFYKHSKDVKIFFVCGADNARFIIPFKDTEIGTVVIERPGYEHIYSQYKNHKSDNVLFGYSDCKLASTEIRKTKEYKEFREVKQKQAYLRIHWNHFEKNVLVELKNWFSHVWTEDFEDQVRDFKTNKITETILNLDVETHHGRKLDVSRLFDLYGQKKLGFTHRPKKLPIVKQIELLLTKQYFNKCYLFDDDIYTGSTMDYIESLLNSYGVKVLGRISFIAGSLKDKEVLDAKDFLLAYDQGGLITKFNGELVRVPYMYPFVCPATRASITDPLQFSINMWEVNMDLWKGKETTIDSAPELHYLIKLGHSRYETMYDVCKYYRDFLQSLKQYS